MGVPFFDGHQFRKKNPKSGKDGDPSVLTGASRVVLWDLGGVGLLDLLERKGPRVISTSYVRR